MPRLDLGGLSLFGYQFKPVLYVYGLVLAIGFLLALAFAVVRAKSYGVDAKLVLDLGLYIIVSAFIGAKLLFVIVHWEHFSYAPARFLSSGGVFYGGFVTATATSIWFFRRQGLSAWSMMDIFAPSVALGHAVGRLGCFSAGCCYGKPTRVLWGVTFTDSYATHISGVPLGVSLHPTQLYESFSELVIFGFLLWVSRRRKFHGQVFCYYLLLYAVARFTIEFFRGDSQRGVFLGGAVSTSQIVAVFLFAASCLVMQQSRHRLKNS